MAKVMLLQCLVSLLFTGVGDLGNEQGGVSLPGPPTFEGSVDGYPPVKGQIDRYPSAEGQVWLSVTLVNLSKEPNYLHRNKHFERI